MNEIDTLRESELGLMETNGSALRPMSKIAFTQKITKQLVCIMFLYRFHLKKEARDLFVLNMRFILEVK